MPLRSIHIIDDNETDRYLLKRLIKDAALTNTIYESDNGSTAIDFLVQQEKMPEDSIAGFPPNLIFLDINMPVMGGFEFLEEYSNLLSQFSNLTSTVLTMFTSSESKEDKKKALSYNFVKGYIVKFPSAGGELTDILRGHFDNL